MQDEWAEVRLMFLKYVDKLFDFVQEPNIYLSITGPGFPNYWVINGPRGNWGQGCILPSVRSIPRKPLARVHN